MARESYINMKRRFESEINQLPIRAAFNKQQANEMMESWGIKPTVENYRSNVVSLGGGMYILKKNYPNLKELFDNQAQELNAALESDVTGEEFIREAFEYELSNHEWILSGDIEPALTEIGLSYEALRTDQRFATGLELAKEKIRKWHEEND